MVYRLTMRTFMVFEYIHPSGIKLRPARPLTNSILCIYNPIGNEWMHLCKEDIHGHLELLTYFSNGATMYQVIEGLKKVEEADLSPFRRYRIKDWIRARDIMNISVDQFMNRLKRRVDSGRWEEPSEKNWFNSYIEVASLKR